MDQGSVLEIGRQAIQVALSVSLPILVVTLFIGLLVSVFQAMTQIQEASLTFVPKLIGVAIAMAAMGGWMLSTLVRFTTHCFEQITRMGA